MPADMAESFLALQRRFAAHLRDPDAVPAPAGLEDRRVGIYRELFFNNVVQLLAGGFPVLRSMLDETGWRGLVRRWYREYRAHTPLFPELGREFVRWLQDSAEQHKEDPLPDWYAELAHYEWMEVVAANDETELASLSYDRDGDLLEGRPLVSPLAWLLVYRHPVHRIRSDAPPGPAPEHPTCLIIVRARDDRVSFLEANPWTLRLLERLREPGDETGRDVLSALAVESGLDCDGVVAAGHAVLQRLRERDIVLGTR